MRPDFNKMELIPAIVQDYQTKEVLMLAYVNEEAYDKMLELKQTVFYSRSRQKLWHKGEESGHFQDIKGMYLDCDLDTLLIYVEQIGAACHTGAYSCFFNEIMPYDNTNIFRSLETLIEDRKLNPVEKSYTNYLLDQGVDKICKKVGEEASETIIAAKNTNKDELVEKLCKLEGMHSVSLNVNTNKSNVILGSKIINLYGPGYIEDYIGDVKFRISPLSFFQVNPVQTEKLYNKALEYADLSGNEIVWDLYCGIGSISLFLAKKAKKVLGVEIVPEAIEDARLNAKINKIDNSEFFVGAAEDVVTEYFSKHENEAECKPDVIVVDPPRKGCDEKLLSTIVKMNPKRVVYVSCDSATLARDVKWLSENGYKLKEATPCDMFGQTVHVETVCLLSRKEPN